MEWQFITPLIIGGALLLMLTGLPVAFCFLFISFLGLFFFLGGEVGLRLLAVSILRSVSNVALIAVPLFIMMGEVLFHSGLAPRMIDALDKWLGRMPGRLSLLAVAGGTLFATMSGSSLSGVAMLGTTMMPEMSQRGYKKPMTLGPILGSAGLSVMIPPSSLGVILAFLALVSIGKVLIAIIIPGLMLACVYAVYIIVRCRLQPHIAPVYDAGSVALSDKLIDTVRHILPVGFIIFLVVGVIFLGVATPQEAAATGALGCFLLAAAHRRLNWAMVKRSTIGTIEITGMIFMILCAAKAFSQVLAAAGATRGLIEFTLGLPLSPIFVVVGIMITILIMGCFLDSIAIMMITVPAFMPAVVALGFDPIWFAVLFLLNLEMATTTPPFGLTLFVMKGVAPVDTTMKDIYLAALPFIGCDLIVLALLIAFPAIALWLPGLMY